MASSGPKLTPCFFLLPLTFNDGSRVEREMRARIEDALFVEFGGWTIEGTKRGAYRRRDTGEKQVEITQRIRIDVAGEAEIERLRGVVIEIGLWLGQEAMHFEVATGSEVEILPTQSKGGQSA